MDMVNFTVAICTYNGERRIPQVLEKLRAQIQTEGITWEVIVVDNNSTDKTAAVVQAYQIDWVENGSLTYCFEPKQGLAFARQRAVSKARGEFVGFLDDDNLPAPDWVSQAYKFGQEHDQAGAYGSQIHGDFEVEPPKKIKRIATFLAIIERGKKAFIYEPERKILPPGAGLVVRRDIWHKYVPEQPLLQGRIGRSMLASEDLEVICHIQNAGWEVWYNPAMQMHHKIARHRLERAYLVPMVRGIGLSRHHIRMLRTAPWSRPAMLLLYAANDLRKIVVYFCKYGKSIGSDVVTACEWEFLCSSFISPAYLCGKWIKKLIFQFLNTFPKSLVRLRSAN